MKVNSNHIMKLNPVIALYHYACELPMEQGIYHCVINVSKGEIILTHKSFECIVGLWCKPPVSGTPMLYTVKEGETLEVTLQNSYHDYQPDSICIANNSYLHSAEFTCTYTKE